MTKDYLAEHGVRASRTTPQTEPMRADQVENSAGGYVWEMDKFDRLHRFLILGSEGGTYYASEKDLAVENIDNLIACIKEDGARTVEMIVQISDSGRAPSNDPALFALAAAISHGDRDTRVRAGRALPQVARIGTHLYHFIAYAETMRGWGTVLKRAVQDWYRSDRLALDAIKFRQRDGWSHRDLLRLGHPNPNGYGDNAAVLAWIAHPDSSEITGPELNAYITGFERAQASQSPRETAELVREYRLPREALVSDHLSDPVVWEALLFEGGKYGMPITALIRNLGNMTRIGLLTSSSKSTRKVTEMLTTQSLLQHARVHPIALLIALRTYASGHGFRGGNAWTPVPGVTDALDEAFYLAFDNVVPSGKDTLIGLDVSGSMGMGSVAGSMLTPREASAAMCMVTLHAEPSVEVIGFSDRLVTIGLSKRQRLDDVVKMISGLPFRGTDCALPMIYARENGREFGAFAIYTDDETWYGEEHPKQALDSYRAKSGINARAAVVGMTSTGFSIADPTDAGMMDFVGFDASAPSLIADFFRGDV